MHIEELHLQNFRGFQELKLKLPPDVAVFIGVNGSGKSSILDSIAILLYQFLSQLRLGYDFHLKEDDININSNRASISTRVEVDSRKKLYWEVSKDREQIKVKPNREEIDNYAMEILLRINGNNNDVINDFTHNLILQSNNFILPIIVYYQTNRIFIKSSAIKDMGEEERENTYGDNRLDGYQTAFSENINDFRDLLYWFKEEEYENELRLREDSNFRNTSLEIVRKALTAFLEGLPNTKFSDLHIVRVSSSREGGIRRLNKPSLVIKKNGKDFKLDQLSDGEKTLLMLVVDIARRLAILNPSITNPSELLEHRGNPLKNQHCNPRKGDEEITINPADSTNNCENCIKYSSTGKILSDDETINSEINDILNLNFQTLVDNRKTALNAVIDALNTKFPNKTWSNEAINKKLGEFGSKDAEGKYSAYCQYVVFYLSKRLNNS